MENIRIGTLVNGFDAIRIMPQIKQYGFESYSLTFSHIEENVDLKEMATQLKNILQDSDAVISSVCVYSNPLSRDIERRQQAIRSWEMLIEHAHHFGTDIVAGFTGRIEDETIDGCIPLFKEVFDPLASLAKDKNVRLAFENCEMGGNWERGNHNIAHTPDAWKLIFEALPYEHVGLQWEPCHQMVKLIDPIAQLKTWVPKIFHLHGKDATVDWDIIKKHGINGPHKFAWDRTPGFGDTNWTTIISILRQHHYKGTIDIEGWHDPVYRDDWERTGQVHALNYLKQCRGGRYIPNPK